ncbi:unnamed protein product [Phyllotreta striolata]|uniref:DUF4806 domain-containing protein n=1 Tax=Phyllotreta striolata TaxID=444603 RepID=A0A9P0DWZ0_PHYSR|nr:unnamed protein product [Phyllotreta striolata]
MVTGPARFDKQPLDHLENKIIQYLASIKILCEQTLTVVSQTYRQPAAKCLKPDNLPTEFPLKNIDDLNLIDKYLDEKINRDVLISYLSSLGGNNGVNSITNRILKSVLALQLAQFLSWLGTRNNKLSFSKFHLCNVIINAVKISTSATTAQVENAIKGWLKHAPQVLKNELERRQSSNGQDVQENLHREAAIIPQD